MEWQEIITYIVALVPSLASVIAVATAAIKVIKSFKDLQADVQKKIEMEELRSRLEIALSDNRELKQLLRKDIQTRTHIKED